MDTIGFFLLLTSLLLSYPIVLIAQSPTTTITVVGIVYCDTCSTGTFSEHSYFLSGVEVHIDCRFRASSPRSKEQISFSVNRTTDREGAYKLDIPSVDGVNCESAVDNSDIESLCEARLIETSPPYYSCNVPFLESTRSSVISKQDNNLCVYSLGALSYKPPQNMINTTLCSTAPGGLARKAPNKDKEVITAVMQAFEKISENAEEQKLLRDQFATFHMKKGIYAMGAAQVDAVTMDPIDWWSTYGSETPELAEVAKKVLSQPISSSSAERNWSTYGYIHNVKRNRLNCERADKLVFIHSNIRLQSRFSDAYKNGPFKKWEKLYFDIIFSPLFCIILTLHVIWK